VRRLKKEPPARWPAASSLCERARGGLAAMTTAPRLRRAGGRVRRRAIHRGEREPGPAISKRPPQRAEPRQGLAGAPRESRVADHERLALTRAYL
jgi:hypothetical protein